MTYNNNVAFSKVGDGYNIRASFGNVSVKGNIPRSTLNKTTFQLKHHMILPKD